jgi:membrane protease YdiL (CAAX protease family)
MNKNDVVFVLRHSFLMISTILLIELLKNIFNYNESSVSIIEEEFKKNFFFTTIGVLIFAPIIEELIFRVPLKKNSLVWCSVVFISIYIFSSNLLIIKILCLIYVLSIILYQYYDKSKLILYLIMILSTISFVAIHIDNYDITAIEHFTVYNYIVLFLPQFFLSVVLIKVRMQKNVLSAVLTHSLYNSVMLLLALLFNL